MLRSQTWSAREDGHAQGEASFCCVTITPFGLCSMVVRKGQRAPGIQVYGLHSAKLNNAKLVCTNSRDFYIVTSGASFKASRARCSQYL